jgi:hypothetical protein
MTCFQPWMRMKRERQARACNAAIGRLKSEDSSGAAKDNEMDETAETAIAVRAHMEPVRCRAGIPRLPDNNIQLAMHGPAQIAALFVIASSISSKSRSQV